ncbi:hypothetical protein [Nocardia wallacei]|uniref:hypothetical protein n=1 Tax=Nocardia wallacei TaxID=480035 RepID=UPI002455F372|nr:hypothetical protein [Nocardia wallacei]
MNPNAADRGDREGAMIPDRGHTLVDVDVRDGTVRIALHDIVNDNELILTLLPEQAAEFADWVDTAATAAAAQNHRT